MKKKMSLTLSELENSIIEDYKERKGTTISATVGELIRSFCSMPKEVENEMREICKQQLEKTVEEKKSAGEYSKAILEEKEKAYKNMCLFFGVEKRDIEEKILDKEGRMQKIKMLNGTLVCPEDIIIVNREDAKISTHASILEVCNAKMYVPHFIYFAQKDATKYTEADCLYVEQRCVEVYPQLQEILEKVVEPQHDPETGECVNKKEFKDSPKIGHFSAYRRGETRMPGWKPPMGIEIV